MFLLVAAELTGSGIAGIPLDTQWSDVDYMKDYRDFTYDKVESLGGGNGVAGVRGGIDVAGIRGEIGVAGVIGGIGAAGIMGGLGVRSEVLRAVVLYWLFRGLWSCSGAKGKGLVVA